MLLSAMPFATFAADEGEISEDEGRSPDISDVWKNDYKINLGGDNWRYYDEY